MEENRNMPWIEEKDDFVIYHTETYYDDYCEDDRIDERENVRLFDKEGYELVVNCTVESASYFTKNLREKGYTVKLGKHSPTILNEDHLEVKNTKETIGVYIIPRDKPEELRKYFNENNKTLVKKF